MFRTGINDLRHVHGPDHTVAGYLAVLTDWSDGFPCKRTVVAEFEGSTSYLAALAAAKVLRVTGGPNTYGVVDTVYVCGCESDGERVPALTERN